MLGSCRLCKETKELKGSHVIPKLIYRYMRRHQDDTHNLNGLLVLDSEKNKIDVTQRQWKSFLFCNDCEILLSKNETKFARILCDINSLDKDEIKKTSYSTDHDSLFLELKKSKCKINFDMFKKVLESGYFNEDNAETLKYFAASFVLRQLYIIDHNLGGKEIEMLESYIFGKAVGNFSLIVNLNAGEDFWAFCSSLTIDQLDDFKHYNFVVPNIWFHLIFDINNTMGIPKVLIQPDDFKNNDVIVNLLSQFYKDAQVSKKAELAISKQ
ncbi:hypothetical protein BCU90_11710 [Vibrio lentus]|uniref:hypothetical protein n=1 Tax=Vibrio lentus TaxID=136468 RepID=UPI000C8239ED|nr:hypothetical protein [Vibrio lentus]PMG47497.1 hypothetical protein BCU90_11710 [Vibrio lentus]